MSHHHNQGGFSNLASSALAYDVLKRNPEISQWVGGAVGGLLVIAFFLLPVAGIGFVIEGLSGRTDPNVDGAQTVDTGDVPTGLTCIGIFLVVVALGVHGHRRDRHRRLVAERADRDYAAQYKEQFCSELGGQMGHAGLEKLWRIWTAPERSYAEQAWLDDLVRGWERRNPAEWPSQTDARLQGYLCTCTPPQHSCGITGQLEAKTSSGSRVAPMSQTRNTPVAIWDERSAHRPGHWSEFVKP